jgi:two-component system response regulator HupR/HoxA
MINWDEFEHIHVIRKLKEVISRWWSIDVYFGDDRGNLKIIEKGTKRDFSNPICHMLLQRDDGYDSLTEFVRTTIGELRKTQEKDLIKEWLPNLITSSLPIVIDNEFM